jgi:hypothetical protein
MRSCAGVVAETVERAKDGIATDDPRERQKAFWMGYASPLGSTLSGCATDVWLGRRDAMEAIEALVLKNVGTNARFDRLTEEIGFPKLDFGFDGDP